MVTGPGPAGLDERDRRAERPRVRPRLSRKGRTGNHGRVTETPETSSTPTQVPGARPPWSFLMDMDGVLVHEEHIIPGADEFIAELTARGANFVVVTNNPIYTRRDLRARLLASGLDIPEDRIWTSALATAKFLDSQRPGRQRVRHRGGRPDHRHARGRLRADRPQPRLRRAGGDQDLLVRGDHHRDPADRGRRPVRRVPTRTRPGRAGRGCCLRPAPSRR